MSPSASRLRRSLERAGPLGVALILGAALVVSSGLSYRDARSTAGFVGERQGIGLLHRLDAEVGMRERADGTMPAEALKAALDANRALGLTYVGLLDGEGVVADAGAPLLADTHPQVGAPAFGHRRIRMVSPGPPGGPPFDRLGSPPGPPPPPLDDNDERRRPPPPFDDRHSPHFHPGPAHPVPNGATTRW